MRHFILNFSILGVIALGIISCTKENIETPTENFYTVQIGIGGEINVEHIPMTKSTPNGILGIQVYSKPINDENASWTPYSYYLYDLSSLNISLSDGYKYKFEATLVVDGLNKLGNSAFNGQIAPFVLMLTAGAGIGFIDLPVRNFKYDTQQFLKLLSSSTAQMQGPLAQGGGVYNRPNIDRYYGITEDFVPSAENTTVNIDMKRVSFGAKFVITGTLTTSGTIGIEIKDAPKKTLTLSSTTENNKISDIFTFDSITDAYTTDTYTETIPVKIVWTRTDGREYTVGTYNIVYQRKTITIVTVQIDNASSENGFGVTINDSESADMPEPGTNDVTIIDGEIQ